MPEARKESPLLMKPIEPNPYKIAVFTMVYNEWAFLPIWISHYAKHFGLSNLFIIDESSTDGSTDLYPAENVIRIPRTPLDQDVRARNISRFHAALLKHYDAVIYTDVDEILVLDPLLKMDLSAYIQRHVKDHANAFGLHVLHNTLTETEYSNQRPLFEQRRYAQFERFYCKQLIHKTPVEWQPGFHWSDKRTRLGVGLYLFHLRAMDYNIAWRRIENRNKLKWSESALQKGQGEQNRLDAESYMERFFISEPQEYANAIVPSEFNKFVTNVATLIENNSESRFFFYHETHMKMVTIPPRFRQTIGAVDFSLFDTSVDPSRSFSPQEVYAAATA